MIRVEPTGTLSPEELAAVCSHIAREWGGYGYRIRGINGNVVAFSHSDGSQVQLRFNRRDWSVTELCPAEGCANAAGPMFAGFQSKLCDVHAARRAS